LLRIDVPGVTVCKEEFVKHSAKSKSEQGIALFAVLVVLLLLSAMAVGLMYLSSTETKINSNFRTEQTAYFAARAGLEELRDRMMASSPNTTIAASLPPAAPTATGGNVLYIVNPGTGSTTSINPWDSTSSNFDTDLCHDGYLGLTATTVGTPCTASYTGSPTIVQSTLPFAGTAAALSYKWARVALKVNGSVPGATVNSSVVYPSTNVVCWNGVYEVVLPSTYTQTGASCSSMSPSANPVYMITALAVTKTGARKMVQGEVALNPAQPFPYGLFATGTGCGAVTLSGGATTDSYTTANGGTYQSTKTSTGGDVGANGNVYLSGSSWIGGAVGSTITPSMVGSCPAAPMTINGGSGGIIGYPTSTVNIIQPISTVTVPTPVIANLTGPNQMNPSTLSPGNYGDIKLTSNNNLTLASGTYNINSISISGQATLTITGAVTLNVVGSGVNVPIDLEGGSVTNNSKIASNLQINYAGTSTLKIAGGSATYLTVDAPNANVQLTGNTDIYGAIVGSTISDTGGAAFHYDRNTKSPVPSNSYYSLVSFRELYY
jgi:hypothetical protein